MPHRAVTDIDSPQGAQSSMKYVTHHAQMSRNLLARGAAAIIALLLTGAVTVIFLALGAGAQAAAVRARPPAPAASAAENPAAPTLSHVFKLLGSTPAGAAGQVIVGGALGGLLAQTQPNSAAVPLPASELKAVHTQLDELSAQVNPLYVRVNRVEARLPANAHLSGLFRHPENVILQINSVIDDMKEASNPGRTPQQRASASAKALSYIQRKLLDAKETFDAHLNPDLPVADNTLKDTSKVLAAHLRFFDARASNEIWPVYEYYATCETELGVVLMNYWNSDPTYTTGDKQTNIAKLATTVLEAQPKALKPTVPAGTFIDTRTPKLMWVMSPFPANGQTVINEHFQTSRHLRVHGFDNYQMPSFHDFRNLLRGATGDPRAWLQRQVEVRLNNPLVWYSDAIRKFAIPLPFSLSFSCVVRVDIFNLDKDDTQLLDEKEVPTGVKGLGSCHPSNFGSPAIQGFLQRQSGALLLLRYLADNESYYW
jgi:hypothetical protein